MSTDVAVSVIVPHYHDLKALETCLAGLERQTYPRDKFEIVVADNASPEGDSVAALVERRAHLVVVEERGAGSARNGGVAASRGRILAFVDCDCQPAPEWLEEGVAALARHDFVGGRVIVLVEDPDRLTPVEAFERVFAFNFQAYITKKGFSGSGNLFCSRKLFDRVGGFRNGVSEDVDWSQRARALGYRLGYAPKAVVGHPARRTWNDLVSKWRRVNSEMYHLGIRQRGGGVAWLVKACLMPASALAHSPRVLFSRDLEGFSQRMGALDVLYRLRLWRMLDSLRLLTGG